MGYRSTIRFSTTKAGYGFLLKQLEAEQQGIDYPLVGTDVHGHAINFDFLEEFDGRGIVFGFDSVKWYPEFADVQAFERAVDALDERGYPWMSVRVGEDYDDIEVHEGTELYHSDIPFIAPDTAIAIVL